MHTAKCCCPWWTAAAAADGHLAGVTWMFMNACHGAVAHRTQSRTALWLHMLAAAHAASSTIGICHVVLRSYCTMHLAINCPVGDFHSDLALFPHYFGQTCYYYCCSYKPVRFLCISETDVQLCNKCKKTD